MLKKQYVAALCVLVCCVKFSCATQNAYTLATVDESESAQTFLDKYGHNMVAIERDEFEIARKRCKNQQDVIQCLLGYLQTICVKNRNASLIVSLSAQAILWIYTGLNVNPVPAIPAEGALVGIAFSGLLAPFSTMKLSTYIGKGKKLLFDKFYDVVYGQSRRSLREKTA